MKNYLILFIFYLLIINIECDISEKELEDLEEDMVFALRKFKKTKEEEIYIRDKLCKRNLKAKEWDKLSRFCFDKATSGTKCIRCKELFIESYEYCNKKVPQTDGCDEITFNKRGACQVESFEMNRKEHLLTYKNNKEEFVVLVQKINDCYKKVIDDGTYEMLK